MLQKLEPETIAHLQWKRAHSCKSLPSTPKEAKLRAVLAWPSSSAFAQIYLRGAVFGPGCKLTAQSFLCHTASCLIPPRLPGRDGPLQTGSHKAFTLVALPRARPPPTASTHTASLKRFTTGRGIFNTQLHFSLFVHACVYVCEIDAVN